MNDDPEFEIADAFKRPEADRAASLAGRLTSHRPRRERTQSPQSPEEPTAEEGAAQSEPAPQQAPTARSRRSSRVASTQGDGRLVITLPMALRDRARAHGSGRGETYLDVALAAVQETYPRLPALIQARRESEGTQTATDPSPGGLFEHRPRRRRAPEATAQVTIRGLTGHDRRVLERLVDETGAANLTELLTVALDDHLPQRPRSLR